MFIRSFKGGIRLDDKNYDTQYLKIEPAPTPEFVYLPVTQHLGTPNKTIVQKGDAVKLGQIIAASDAHISAPLHASVSGVVVGIDEIMHPGGVMVPAIIIKNDGLDTPCNNIGGDIHPDDLTAREIVEAVRKAGIIGMGGEGFPTHVQLSPPTNKKIDTYIVNGAECEPYLTGDYRVMLETPEELIIGAKTAIKALGLPKAVIVVEDNKYDAYETLCAYSRFEENIEVYLVDTKYPQGSEHQIIQSVLGREIPPGKYSEDVGVVVNNIETCAAIGRAVKSNMPVISRVVTVSGGAFKSPRNYRVRIGTTVRHLVDSAGGFCKQPSKLIAGGSMTGISINSLDVAIQKNTRAILALTDKEVDQENEGPCIRCGKCVSACPMRLQPLFLSRYALTNNYGALVRLNIMDCIGCGSCSYICPAKKHLAQNIRTTKQSIISNQRRVKHD